MMKIGFIYRTAEREQKKIAVIILIILGLASAVIRFKQTANNQFPFTFDQARDMLNVRIPGTFKHLPLVGPTTSINGVMLGPGYYYFNLIPFWLGSGSPQALVDWNTAWFLVAGIIIFCFFYKRDVWLGLVIAVVYLWSPQLFNATRYFWNAHAMVYMAVLFFLALWHYVNTGSRYSALGLGVMAGVTMQFEAAMAIVMVIFSLLIVLGSKKKEYLAWYLVGLLPWFLPQVIFEVNKKFGMTKLLIAEFSQSQGILGDKLSLTETAKGHWRTILKYMEGQFILPYGWGKLVLGLSLVGGLGSKKYRRTMVFFVLFFIFTLGFYTVIYRHGLKQWYLESMRVWYIFVAGTGIVGWGLILKKKRFLLGFYVTLMVIFICRTLYLTVADQKQFINNPNFAKDDPKLAEHQIKAIDWIYQRVGGANFKAYNYVPEVYDYSYQYLYWWYGEQRYGYRPVSVSYLPDVPLYIPRQNEFGNTSGVTEQSVGLLYERQPGYGEWLKKFDQYCIREKIDFGWQVSGEIREKCKK